jgi:hypothetical protein
MTTYAHDHGVVFAVWHGEREARAEVVAVLDAGEEVLDDVCRAMTAVSEALWASYGVAAWFYPGLDVDRLEALAVITAGERTNDTARYDTAGYDAESSSREVYEQLVGACGELHDVTGRLDEAASAVIVAEMYGELARVVHAEHGELAGRAGQLATKPLVATSLNDVLEAHLALCNGEVPTAHRHVRCVALAHRVRSAVALVAWETGGGQLSASSALCRWFGTDTTAIGALLDEADAVGVIPTVRAWGAGVGGRWYDETWAALCEVLWRLEEWWRMLGEGRTAEEFDQVVTQVALEGTDRLVGGVLVDAGRCWCEECP